MQNKYSRKVGRDFTIPKVNTRQFYLLSERVAFDPLTTGLPSNILKTGLCHGAGSYGDFFYDGANYDMRFFVAKTLFPKNKQSVNFYDKKKMRSFFNTYLDGKWLNCNNGKFECSHTSNLDDFEIMSRKMLIGSPIDFNDKDITRYFVRLIKFIIKASNKSGDGLLERLNVINSDDDVLYSLTKKKEDGNILNI